MTPLGVLPAFVPTEALLIGLAAFVVFVVLMNRGLWWIVNLLAQKEPAAMAIGVFFAVWAPSTLVVAIGVALVGIGLAAYVHPEFDL